MHPFIGRFFSGGVYTVHWIRQVLSLDTPLDQLFVDRERKRERKKALAFQSEISEDPADLQFFYENLYVKYLQKRHQNPAILEFDFIKNYYLENNGEIIFIKKDTQVVGGGVCHLVGETYFLRVLGLTDESLVKDGAIAALYYYSILKAQERGAKYVDFGLSRPFLSDGVLVYKRKWGGSIRKDHENNHVLYLKNLLKNGLIILEDNTLKAVITGNDDIFSRKYPDEGIEFKEIR
jgi:Acetyltransferase (GNAT) domain